MLKLACNVCSKEFLTYPSRINGKNGRLPRRFCSPKCGSIGNKNAMGHTGVFGEQNVMWKGDEAGYGPKHGRVKRRLGTPKFCEICKRIDKTKYEWASKSHKYLDDLSDWVRLCTSCHRKYDMKFNKYKPKFTDPAFHYPQCTKGVDKHLTPIQV